MKTFLLSFLIVYSFSNKEITGIVYDKNTKEKLTGVTVIVNKTDTTYTNFDGVFHIQTDSIKTIDVTYPSYNKEGFNMIKINKEELWNLKNLKNLSEI